MTFVLPFVFFLEGFSKKWSDIYTDVITEVYRNISTHIIIIYIKGYIRRVKSGTDINNIELMISGGG